MAKTNGNEIVIIDALSQGLAIELAGALTSYFGEKFEAKTREASSITYGASYVVFAGHGRLSPTHKYQATTWAQGFCWRDQEVNDLRAKLLARQEVKE